MAIQRWNDLVTFDNIFSKINPPKPICLRITELEIEDFMKASEMNRLWSSNKALILSVIWEDFVWHINWCWFDRCSNIQFLISNKFIYLYYG